MAGVPDSQPSEVSSEVPNQDLATAFVKHLASFKMPQEQQAPAQQEQPQSTNVAETPPGPDEAALAAIDAQHGVAAAPSEAQLDEIDKAHGVSAVQEAADANQKVLDPNGDQGASAMTDAARGALKSLPAIGAVAGGTMGFASPAPGGMLAGGAMGAIAGKELERAGRHYLMGESVSSGEEHAKETGMAGAEGALQVPGEQAATAAAESAGPALTKALSKISEIPLVGKAVKVSEDALKTFVSRAKVVQQMSESVNGSVAAAAEKIKSAFQTDLSTYFQHTNDAVTKVLQAAGPGEFISPKPAIDSIDESINTLRQGTASASAGERQAKINNLEDLKNSIMNKTNPENGKLAALDANKIKQELWKRGFEQSGNITDEAKAAGHALNAEISEVVPAARQLNTHQAKVYNLLDTSSGKSLLGNKPEKVLKAAGNAIDDGRAALEVGQLQQATGSPVMDQANNLAAMKTFTGKGAKVGNKIVGATARVGNATIQGTAAVAPPAIQSGIQERNK